MFIRPKCLVSRHRDVPHLGYDIQFSLSSLEFRTSFFSRRRAKTRGRAANNAEHTSAVEYGEMLTADEYNSVARKRPKYNVFEKKTSQVWTGINCKF
jgi:hypothetical protein